MIGRVRYTLATTGLVLSAIGVVAVPAAALISVAFGVLIGVLVGLRAQNLTPRDDAPATGTGRRAGVIAGGAGVAGASPSPAW